MNREELIAEAANAMSQGYVQDGRISSFFELAEVAFAVFEAALIAALTAGQEEQS